MSEESSSCVWCERRGVLGCRSVVAFWKMHFCLQCMMGLGLCVTEDHSVEVLLSIIPLLWKEWQHTVINTAPLAPYS